MARHKRILRKDCGLTVDRALDIALQVWNYTSSDLQRASVVIRQFHSECRRNDRFYRYNSLLHDLRKSINIARAQEAKE